MAKFKLSLRSLQRLNGIESVLIAIVTDAIAHPDCPYDFGIPQHGGKRTAGEQNLLYHKGVSQKDGFIKLSYHQTGKAFDIYGFVNGKASWDHDVLEAIARHIMKIAAEKYGITLRWGGDWDADGIRVDRDNDESFFDGAHFELR